MDNHKDKAIAKLNEYLNDAETLANNPGIDEKIKKWISEIEKMSPRTIKSSFKLQNGQFYRVLLPDVKYYLDEDSSYNDQPAIAKKALKEIEKNKDDQSIYDQHKKDTEPQILDLDDSEAEAMMADEGIEITEIDEDDGTVDLGEEF